MPKRAAKSRTDWRETGREIAIVVVGVFIALVAQQVVDNIGWGQRVRSAEDAIRHELLADDGPQVYQRVALHPCMQAHLDKIRAAIEAGADRSEIAALVKGYKVVFVTYDRVAYDGAMSSQVTTHMGPGELDRFTVPYTTLPAMDAANRQEAADLARLRGIRHEGAGRLWPVEETQILSAVEALRNDENMIYAAAVSALPAIRKIGPLDQGRIDFYMGVARSAYGDCVRPVPENWPG